MDGKASNQFLCTRLEMSQMPKQPQKYLCRVVLFQGLNVYISETAIPKSIQRNSEQRSFLKTIYDPYLNSDEVDFWGKWISRSILFIFIVNEFPSIQYIGLLYKMSEWCFVCMTMRAIHFGGSTICEHVNTVLSTSSKISLFGDFNSKFKMCTQWIFVYT